MAMMQQQGGMMGVPGYGAAPLPMGGAAGMMPPHSAAAAAAYPNPGAMAAGMVAGPGGMPTSTAMGMHAGMGGMGAPAVPAAMMPIGLGSGTMGMQPPQMAAAQPEAPAPRRSAIPEWLKAEILKKQQSAAAGARGRGRDGSSQWRRHVEQRHWCAV